MKAYTLITGATGGLGREFALLAAKRGDNLVLTGRNAKRLDETFSLAQKENPNVHIVAKICDLSSEDSRREFFKFLEDEKIKVNYLINNAGYILEGDFLKQSEGDSKNIIRVNCEGTIDLTEYVLRNRDAENLLTILTISSMSADYPMPHMALYGATKAFLTSFMTALAYELKDENVSITTIMPSGIPTTNEMKEAIAAQGYFGRVTAMSAKDVAKFSLKAAAKHKVIAIPKSINRFLTVMSRPLSDKAKARFIGKRWGKAQEKRNFYKEDKKNAK